MTRKRRHKSKKYCIKPSDTKQQSMILLYDFSAAHYEHVAIESVPLLSRKCRIFSLQQEQKLGLIVAFFETSF